MIGESRTGRAALAATAAAPAIFGVLLLIVPAFAVGFDEAKYLGIGANLWAGRGPDSAFGVPFLLHPPLWSAVLYASQALAGFDAVTWGHILDGIAGIGVVALTAAMARRSSAVAGIVAAFAILAFGYLLALTRTTRLDVPVAALGLLYLEVGWIAVRGGSRRWAIGAGIVYALAVLVKEVAIPLAPVPILCGVLADVPWRRVLRSTAWILLAASIGLAPWFIYYSQQTGYVYRVGSPAWTLPLLFLPVLALIVLGFASSRLAESRAMVGATARFRPRLPASIVAHGRSLFGWGVAAGWSVAFLFFFSRISRLAGASLFQAAQFRFYFETWALDLAPVALFCASGLVLAILLLASDGRAREHRGVVNALVATICGAPLVLMVIAVGEPPRNYIAQVATAVALAAGAWTWAIGRVVARFATDGRRPRLARWGMPATAMVAIVLGTSVLGIRTWPTRAGSGDGSSSAVSTTVAWVKANVPAGTPIAFGSFLSYNMAYDLVAEYPLYQLPARIATLDPAQPMGFRRAGDLGASDWVAADIAPRNVNQYETYRATWIENAVRRWNIGYWVYATGIDTASPAILGQLTADHGFDPVVTWTFGPASAPYSVTIFRVDLAHVALDRSHLYVSSEALRRLVTRLAQTPAASRAAAAALVGKIVVVPTSGGAAADLARLKALAGP